MTSEEKIFASFYLTIGIALGVGLTLELPKGWHWLIPHIHQWTA